MLQNYISFRISAQSLLVAGLAPHTLYQWGMETAVQETTERLIRVRTTRRGIPVELRVHYEIVRLDGCDSIRVFTVEDAE